VVAGLAAVVDSLVCFWSTTFFGFEQQQQDLQLAASVVGD
jgi:hypothetical protein